MARTNLRKNYALRPELPVYTGVVDSPISDCIPTSSATAHSISTFFCVTDVVLGSGEEILVKMQHEIFPNTWLDVGEVASVTVDVDGIYAIRLDRGVPVEALVLPLGQPTRLVITTGATSSLTVTEVNAMIGE